MTDTTQPPTPNAAAHPGLALLSGLVDDELDAEEASATRAHLRTCAPCRRETARLTAARAALAKAPHPVAPAGSSDRAVVAALLITSPLVAEAAGELPAASPETPAEQATPASPQAGVTRSIAGRDGREGAVRRHPGGVALRAAAAVLVAAALGAGLVARLRSDHAAGPLRAGPAETTSPRITGGTLAPSSTLPHGGVGGPVLGVFDVQLRPEVGSAACTKVVRHVATLHGVSVTVNPPAGEGAVLRAAGGGAGSCVALGPAFVTIWSGNVVTVSVRNVTTASSRTPAGTRADVVIRLAPNTLGTAALRTAETPGVTLAAIAAGSDIGGAIVGSGQVVTIPLSRPMALLVARQLA